MVGGIPSLDSVVSHSQLLFPVATHQRCVLCLWHTVRRKKGAGYMRLWILGLGGKVLRGGCLKAPAVAAVASPIQEKEQKEKVRNKI